MFGIKNKKLKLQIEELNKEKQKIQNEYRFYRHEVQKDIQIQEDRNLELLEKYFSHSSDFVDSRCFSSTPCIITFASKMKLYKTDILNNWTNEKIGEAIKRMIADNK